MTENPRFARLPGSIVARILERGSECVDVATIVLTTLRALLLTLWRARP